MRIASSIRWNSFIWIEWMCAPEPCGETMQNKMPLRSLWQKLLKERKENTAQHMYEANVCCFVSSLLKGKTNFEMALKKGERHMGRDSESHKLHVSLIAIKYSKYVAGSTARTSKHIRWLLCRRTTVKIDQKLEKHGNKHWKYDLIVCATNIEVVKCRRCRHCRPERKRAHRDTVPKE